MGPGNPPNTMVCNDPETHEEPHYWQDPHSGLTCWCPGHTEVE
jgi:hypothetical protein